jgi:peptidoglycan/xylan/chitin deacetylase (PgdA/CDA1 family)
LFRPPYGRLTIAQYNKISRQNQIAFWDVISGDFDPSNDVLTVKKNVLDNVRNGSVIVMHDSIKAMKNLKGSLSDIIDELKANGYSFGVL